MIHEIHVITAPLELPPVENLQLTGDELRKVRALKDMIESAEKFGVPEIKELVVMRLRHIFRRAGGVAYMDAGQLAAWRLYMLERWELFGDEDDHVIESFGIDTDIKRMIANWRLYFTNVQMCVRRIGGLFELNVRAPGEKFDLAVVGVGTDGTALLGRWSTEEHAPTYRQMSAVVAARRNLDNQAPATYAFAVMGGGVCSLAILAATIISMGITNFHQEVDPYDLIFGGCMFGGALIGLALARLARRRRKKRIRDRFAASYRTIAWAL